MYFSVSINIHIDCIMFLLCVIYLPLRVFQERALFNSPEIEETLQNKNQHETTFLCELLDLSFPLELQIFLECSDDPPARGSGTRV